MQVFILAFEAGDSLTTIPCDSERAAWKAAAYEALSRADEHASGDEQELVEEMKEAFRDGDYQQVCDIYEGWMQEGTIFIVQEQELLDEDGVDRWCADWKPNTDPSESEDEDDE